MPEPVFNEKQSFVRFVYPFRFDDKFEEHSAQINQAVWQGEKGPIQVWEKSELPHEDLLSYVADYLNPPGDNEATALLWDMENRALTTVRGGLGAQKAHYSLKKRGLEIPFEIKRVELALFRIGVGFLTLEVQPYLLQDDENLLLEKQPLKSYPLEIWLNFVHHFRFFSGQRAPSLECRMDTGYDHETKKRTYGSYFPQPCGGLPKTEGKVHTVNDLVCGILATANLAGDPAHWYHDVFISGQLLPYVVLFASDVAEVDIPLLVHQCRNFFHSEEGRYDVAERLQEEDSGLLPNANHQWHFFSLDGGGYLACNPPLDSKFFNSGLTDHLRRHYFLLFLLALQQRFVLMILLNAVAENCPVYPGCKPRRFDSIRNYHIYRKREHAFKSIREKLMFFTARGYFAQAMKREHHHRCYKKWQETFQIERLYQEVSDEVRYLSDQFKESLQSMLNIIAWIFGIPILVIEALQASGDVPRLVAFGVLGAGILTGIGVYKVLRRTARL